MLYYTVSGSVMLYYTASGLLYINILRQFLAQRSTIRRMRCTSSRREDKEPSEIPHSANISRHIIFAFFADWNRTSKIKLREILEHRTDANGILGPLNFRLPY